MAVPRTLCEECGRRFEFKRVKDKVVHERTAHPEKKTDQENSGDQKVAVADKPLSAEEARAKVEESYLL